MKFKSSMKKILAMAAITLFTVTSSGCRVPTDASGAIKQITLNTTFKETMASENWFNAILVWPMAQFLNHATPAIGVVGAIIVLTVLVNAVLLAFTLKSTIASQQMQLIQPEMQKIQKKYEGKTDEASKMKQASEMQALYSKYNVNPFSMILITFLQFPVIISIYQAVQRATAIKTGTLLGLSLETTPLAGIKVGQFGYILIFAIMAVCQYFSMMLPQWLAKKREEEAAAKAHRRPEPQSNQNKMMQYYMLVMILVFGLIWPAAMAIYWAINSLVTIVKTLVVQSIINKKNLKEGH